MIRKAVKALRERFLRNMIAPAPIFPAKWRAVLYRLSGIDIGNANVQPRCYIVGDDVRIDDEVFINHSCIIHGPGSSIRIGKGTWLAMNVTICTSTHEIGGPERRAGAITPKPIVIGTGCWIGAGVTIGDGCIVAAGAVVTRDCEPNGLYAGVPAKRVRDLPLA